MIEFIWDSKFKKNYRKIVSKNPELKSKFSERMHIFSLDPFDMKLRTHKLSGILKDCWAFSIDYEIRIVFKFLKEDRVLLIDIGKHEDVY